EAPDTIQFDGLDISKVLLGASAKGREEPVMWVRPPDRPGPDNGWPDLAIRKGKWKLLVNTDGTDPELYNLQADPGETINVAERKPDIASNLKTQVLDWFNTIISNTTGSVEPWE